MNKCIKALLIVCGVIATTGIILSVVGVCIGGDIRDVKIDRYSLFSSSKNVNSDSNGSGNQEVTSDDLVDKSYDITDTVDELHLDMDAAKVKIVTGDTFRVEITDEPENYITVETKNGVLNVKENDGYEHSFHLDLFPFHIGSNSFETKVTIYIPENQKFSKVDISVQAGSLSVEQIMAEEGKIDIDAGSFTGDKVQFEKSCDLSVEAGSIQIKNELQTNKLKASVNAGSIDLKNVDITDDSELSCSAGTITLGLIQPESYYQFKADSSIGSVRINNQKSNDYKSTNSNSSNVDLKIKCEVGTVNVTTK